MSAAWGGGLQESRSFAFNWVRLPDTFLLPSRESGGDGDVDALELTECGVFNVNPLYQADRTYLLSFDQDGVGGVPHDGAGR
jgi:hypothetical protein